MVIVDHLAPAPIAMSAALAAMGLTPSEAARLLFHRIAVDQAFPLELKVPNAQTRAASVMWTRW